MGDAPDHQKLAEEVLGIRGAPPALARTLVAQALVVEDRRAKWRRAGERICRHAPSSPGVYVLKNDAGAAVYVGKAIDIRRRLRTHFADRRWRALKPEMSRVVEAEWVEVGSDLEALLREATLIAELRPLVNVQTGPPVLETRAIPGALVRDVIAILPSVAAGSVELIGARGDGGWTIERARRDGAGLAALALRMRRFFIRSIPPNYSNAPGGEASASRFPLAPIVFSWLAARGEKTTRLDPHDARSAKALADRLAAALRDERLFHERLEQC